MVKNLIDQTCRLFAVFMVLALAAMVVLVFTNVVLRYAFNSGITVSEELSRWLFVWLTFLGAVVALNERAHLGTDALVSRLPTWGKKVCLALSYGLMLFCCWLLFSGSLAQVRINWDTTSAAMEASVGLYFYAAGVVCAVGSAVILLYELWRLVTGRMSDSELIGVRESEDMTTGQEPHH